MSEAGRGVRGSVAEGTTTARRGWRRSLAMIMVWIPVVALVAIGPSWLARLPEVTASHWSGRGVADGFSASRPFWASTTAVAAVVAVGVAVVVRGVPAFVGLWSVIGGAYLTSMAALVWITSAASTLAAPTPERAEIGLGLVIALAGPVLWAVAAFLAHGRPVVDRPVPSASTMPLALEATERAAWSTVITSGLFVWLTVGMAGLNGGLIAAMVASSSADGILAATLVVLVAAIAAVAAFARVRVTADQRGLRLISWLGVPVTRISLAEVRAVRAETIEPMDWGGWGYRWLPGRTAYVLRRGPALVIDRADGRQFAVTLDDPATPAALLERLRAAA